MHATDASAQVSPKALAADLLAFWHFLMRGSAPDMYRVLGELDLSMTHIKALHTLADHRAEAVSVKRLGEDLGMSLPNASRTVDVLLRRGLIERREDEHDRRMKRVRLTEAGSDVVRRVDGARLAGLEQFAASLSDEQRARLAGALADLPHRADPKD